MPFMVNMLITQRQSDEIMACLQMLGVYRGRVSLGTIAGRLK